MIDICHREIVEAVRSALESIPAKITAAHGEISILVPRVQIVQVLTALRDDRAVAMNQLMDVCGVDYPHRIERFDVVYQLLGLKHNWRLTVRVQTDEIMPVPSVVGVYPSAGWFEREVFDLFGIIFSDHPDLRRILTDYGFEGHPLRRDFPLTGFTEVRYDDLQRRVVQEPVKLEQDYRAFDALSPWKGATDVQKREGGE